MQCLDPLWLSTPEAAHQLGIHMNKLKKRSDSQWWLISSADGIDRICRPTTVMLQVFRSGSVGNELIEEQFTGKRFQ